MNEGSRPAAKVAFSATALPFGAQPPGGCKKAVKLNAAISVATMATVSMMRATEASSSMNQGPSRVSWAAPGAEMLNSSSTAACAFTAEAASPCL